jgi:Predicted helicase
MVDAKKNKQRKHKQDEIKFFHVNGTMSSGERKSHLDEFKEAQIGIMSNARCLTEGVDIPTVDAIAFIDPKKSLIDIVQATGRAMRKAEGKDKGYIFVPVVVGEDDDPEECLESSDFKTVWQILQAMVEQDQHLKDKVSRLRVLQGKGEEGSKEWKAAMAEYSEKFEFFNLPGKIDVARFTETLYTKAIEVIAKSWDFWYGLTLKYKQEFGNANAPHRYKTLDGFSLGWWQGTQRTTYNKGKLDNGRIKRLEKIGFIWDVLDEAWEKGYLETLKYKQQFGDANALQKYETPEGFKLGTWQSHQKVAYNKGTLENETIERLEKIGFIWDVFDDAWEKGYQETIKYKQKFGNANSEHNYNTPQGFKLGSWQSGQMKAYKKGKLDNERIKRLEDIGFIWNKHEETFKNGYQETLKYKQRFGNANAPNNYTTQDGYNLGRWQTSRRGDYIKSKLGNEQIKKLKDIGFTWDVLDESWEKGYQESLKYKQEFGDANAPAKYKASDGFSLGWWQGTQRTACKNGILDNDRVKRLNEIGFVWDVLGKTWENGFQESLKYKKQFGMANAPNNYRVYA